MKKNRKIWIGVGAFVLAGGSVSTLPAVAKDDLAMTSQTASSAPSAATGQPQSWQLAYTTGAGGEGGEGGGEGGEGGINVDAAATDPVEYGVALQVIAAHYYAGMAAYEAKEQEAGAQMFAHGLSEVYFEMEDVFKKLGVEGLGKKLEAAVEAGNEKKPVADVKRRVNDVLAGLAAADKKAPKSSASPQAVRAQIVAELLDRAAAQYVVVQKDDSLEAWLDGLGFAIAARNEAKSLLPWLRKQDRKKEQAVQKALTLAGQAYPGIKRAAKGKVTEADLLAAASGAKLAVSNL